MSYRIIETKPGFNFRNESFYIGDIVEVTINDKNNKNDKKVIVGRVSNLLMDGFFLDTSTLYNSSCYIAESKYITNIAKHD